MSLAVNVGPRIQLSGATAYTFQVVAVTPKGGVDEVYEAGKALECSLKLESPAAPQKYKVTL